MIDPTAADPSIAEAADERYMALAIAEAEAAAGMGEIPVGAVLVGRDGLPVASAGNRNIVLHDPSAHAEILVLRRAGEVAGNYRLVGTTLYVTLEPCVMCAAAMVHARIDRLVFGATDPKAGGVISGLMIGRDPRFNHRFNVTGGVLADKCSDLLKRFFIEKRRNVAIDNGDQ